MHSANPRRHQWFFRLFWRKNQIESSFFFANLMGGIGGRRVRRNRPVWDWFLFKLWICLGVATTHVARNVKRLSAVCYAAPRTRTCLRHATLYFILDFFFARFVDVRVYPITDHSDAPRGPYALSNFYETLKLLHSTRSTILGKCKRWSDGNRKGHCDVSKAMRNSRLLQSRVWNADSSRYMLRSGS